MHNRHSLRRLFPLFGLLLAACGGGGEVGAPTSPPPPHEAPRCEPDDLDCACERASVEAEEAYAALRRDCTQDKDCRARAVGACGCAVPLHRDADTTAFERALERAERACDARYVGPGASACVGAILCDFDLLEPTDAVCNTRGECDAP